MAVSHLRENAGREADDISLDLHPPQPAVSQKILEVSDLCVAFPNANGHGPVLNGVGFSLRSGEILGLVGASGSGKSLLAKCLIRLEKPAQILSGSILLQGLEITKNSQRQMRGLRGRLIGYVPQNPLSALDPVYTIGFQFREVLSSHASRKERDDEPAGNNNNGPLSGILRWMKMVDISEARARLRQYPHQWSRGMLQRALLAMSFSTSPRIIILDEVTSALDPTITLQIISLIMRLRKKHHTAILLITHDLSIASEICDSIAVLHEGNIVEKGTVRRIFNQPRHTYTKQLISSMVI